ncbi:MAG TPA: hypothetical protein VGR37_16980 [Longimicrobiaceae bacterium]|nr:hypothetical protein [Longimicrobiaceae bacterium]
MARYEDDYHRRSYRGFSMRPEPIRGRSLDPNYSGGEYRGMRMGNGYGAHEAYGGQAEYGRYRLDNADDLGGFGGYDGIEDRNWRLRRDTGTYEPVRGAGRGYDRQYSGPDEFNWRGHDVQLRGRGAGGRQRVEDGGVRADNRYLHQFNENSPAFRHGGAYDRNFGHAEGAPRRSPGDGPYDRDHFRRDANRYGGKSSGGFAEQWLPKHHDY